MSIHFARLIELNGGINSDHYIIDSSAKQINNPKAQSQRPHQETPPYARL